MRKIALVILALFVFSLSYAQEKIVRVTLKSGTSITGTVSEFNPTSHIVLRVAGFDSRIEMSDVSSIEDLSLSSSSAVAPSAENEVLDYLDQGDYPESYVLQVGPYDVEMILVRGNRFEMGYDGRGSLSMHSEPVHTVQLSSFYVNKYPLDEDIITYLKRGKENHHEKLRVYGIKTVKESQNIAKLISNETNLPVQLISEAQCEYISTTENYENLVTIRDERLFCRDYFSDYIKSSKPQIDPVGPEEGAYVVQRFLSPTSDLAYRRNSVPVIGASSIYLSTNVTIRITLPATIVVGE